MTPVNCPFVSTKHLLAAPTVIARDYSIASLED
jgi:hypothetical protein